MINLFYCNLMITLLTNLGKLQVNTTTVTLKVCISWYCILGLLSSLWQLFLELSLALYISEKSQPETYLFACFKTSSEILGIKRYMQLSAGCIWLHGRGLNSEVCTRWFSDVLLGWNCVGYCRKAAQELFTTSCSLFLTICSCDSIA